MGTGLRFTFPTADDGSAVLIGADNGDAASARITLSGAGGTESFDKPRSDWDPVPKAGPLPADQVPSR